MPTAQKPVVKLGGVELAATSGIAWRFISGVAAYTTTMSVHKTRWDRLQGKLGKPLTLEITDSRAVKTTIEQVYILHLAPSDSPHRVSFVVADKRWLWPYKLVARDFNMPRKTGDRNALGEAVPVELQQFVDEYDYLPYSLQPQRTKWTAQTALEAVLELVDSDGWQVESWPIKDTTGQGDSGQFSLQGVTLRDSGDVALQRLISYIPGAAIYVNEKGQTVVFDASDLDATEEHFRQLPVGTYAGERGAWIDRKAIRPSKVIVHYQKEVEVLLEFEDDYSGGTSSQPVANDLYVDNVIPTTDPETTITEFDPGQGRTVTKKVPPGTFVRVDNWLNAMDADRPEGSLPWTWDTVKIHWFKGDLDAVWVRGKDLDPEGNAAMRLQAFRQHFRQTFRLNRRYMERIRNLRPIRVALLDPVTGARAPAAVWGQGCIVPSSKGQLMAKRGDDSVAGSKYLRNVDYLNPYYAQNVPLLKSRPGPQRVNIVDEELGVFRLEWIVSPYGIVDSFLPCKLVNENNEDGISISRDLKYQEDEPMGAGMIIEGGTNGIFLDDSLEWKAILTAVPSSPNTRQQFHQIEVEATDIQSLFQREFRIKDGDGPPLEVFVSPGEVTARFGITDAAEAYQTQQLLFGLVNPEPGEEPEELPGYTIINEQRELTPHARSLAAEVIAPFADNVQGIINTSIPRDGVKLVGNMTSATVRVGAAPAARVDAMHEFPGQQRSIPRHALMPESARQLILGIVPFKA